MQKHETYSTNRKLALSLAVVAGAVFLISIGVWLENKIVDGAERKAQMYQTALQARDTKELNYSIDTKQGNVLAEVTIKPVDLVKFREMKKKFSKVEKVEETYTQHSRQVCTSDSEGNQTCHTEYYYTWDQSDSWELSAKKVNMADRKYPIDLFSLKTERIDAKDIIKGQKEEYVYGKRKKFLGVDWGPTEGEKRYYYEVLRLPKSGTVFLNVSESVRPVFGNQVELYTKKPKELVTSAQKSAQTQATGFRVFWSTLVIAELGGFGYWVWLYEEYGSY